MSQEPNAPERRAGEERRREERRKQSIPVEVERRRGGDRRAGTDRREEPVRFARFFAVAFAE